MRYCRVVPPSDKKLADMRRLLKRRGAVTIFHMAALWFVILIVYLMMRLAGANFGMLAGFLVGTITFVIGVFGIDLLFKIIRRRSELHLSSAYPWMYRVTRIPAEASCDVTSQEAAIEVGDFGWEAEPIADDGRVYLHGLNEEWKVVWYAGFLPDEIEKICLKPCSQYFGTQYRQENRGSPDHRCPFPVQVRIANTFGYPRRAVSRIRTKR